MSHTMHCLLVLVIQFGYGYEERILSSEFGQGLIVRVSWSMSPYGLP